jgi:hypothetical protein
MVSSGKKGETIHREAREMINHVNHQCKQEAVEKSLILDFVCLLCRLKTANYCGMLVATVKQIRQESREKLGTVKALYF